MREFLDSVAGTWRICKEDPADALFLYVLLSGMVGNLYLLYRAGLWCYEHVRIV